MSELARVHTHREGSTQLVRISGEVDLSNARDVIESVGHAVPDDVTRIVLDLTDTTYVDSAAIATLFRLSERLRDRRQDLRLVVPRTSPIRAVVELTRLSQVIPVDEAVATDLSAPSPVRSVSPLPYAADPDAATTAAFSQGGQQDADDGADREDWPDDEPGGGLDGTGQRNA